MVTSRSSRRTRITSESSSSGGGDSSGSSDSDEQHSNNGSAHEQEEVVRARGQHHVINGPFFASLLSLSSANKVRFLPSVWFLKSVGRNAP